MYRKNALVITMLAAFSVSGPVLAAGGPPNGDSQQGHAAMLALFDLDGDGRITLEEIETVKTEEFQGADLDGNGSLDISELAALEEARRSQREQEEFNFLDANGDGLISSDEFLSMPDEARQQIAAFLFEMAAGEDGVMTIEEFALLKGPEGQLWQHYAQLDQDLSGGISLEEFVGPPQDAGAPAAPCDPSAEEGCAMPTPPQGVGGGPRR